MKDVYAILEESGVKLSDDFDKKAFEKSLFENYKTVGEVEQKQSRITALEEQLTAAKNGLKQFEGVNLEELTGKINQLTADLDKKDQDWQNKILDMEFGHRIDDAISSAKGKNAKAIKALLDMDSLKGSKNQEKDIAEAIEALKKENDYLFAEEDKPGMYAGGTGSGKGGHGRVDHSMDAFRRAAGLKVND